MLKCTGLPFLPGYQFRDINQTQFHKSHHLDLNRGQPLFVQATRPGIGGKPILHADGPPHELPSLYPPLQATLMPPWLAYHRQCLCFYAYFKETLPEVDKVPFQVRKVKIIFFMEDGTMQVYEPRVPNCGISQGCLVSRQRIPRAAPCQHEFVSLQDINVNQTLKLYDRVYFVYGCDLNTRHFLNRLGIPVPDPTEPPTDPGQQLRKYEKIQKQPKKPNVKVDTFGKFLKNDRKVLRFYANWDDRGTDFGDVRDLQVLFHLGDDTVEVKEIIPRNSGRWSNGMFLRRAKLPKSNFALPVMGETAPFTVLNVLGGQRGGRFVIDRLNVGEKDIEYYNENDFTIGATINIWGRPVILNGCDDFTREYYRVKYGLDDFTPKESLVPKPLPLPPRILPVFNGWGQHADSEGNCRTVAPKPPRFDFKKFIKFDGVNLRFGAKMIQSQFKENSERLFVITLYMSDETIAVYEMACRNSGFNSGLFAKRAKVILPNQEWFQSGRPKVYKPQHFYLGARINIRNFKFILTSADLFALTFMENYANEYPKANIDLILNKIREALRPIYKDFMCTYMNRIKCKTDESGFCSSWICFEDLKEMLIALLGDNIVDHEIVTLCRYFTAEKDSGISCSREYVRSCVHAELKRALWNDLARVQEYFYHVVPNRCFIPCKKLVIMIQACNIPLDIQIINDMCSVLKKNEQCEIELNDFFIFLDPACVPSCPIPPINVKRDVCPYIPFTVAGRMVDWSQFIMKLGLEEDLKNDST